jgi:hypothetical protein
MRQSLLPHCHRWHSFDREIAAHDNVLGIDGLRELTAECSVTYSMSINSKPMMSGYRVPIRIWTTPSLIGLAHRLPLVSNSAATNCQCGSGEFSIV